MNSASLEEFEVYAHRGAPTHHPENSLQSIKYALDHGAVGFECDVMLTSDNQPVIVHPSYYNPRKPRMVDTREKLSRLTWQELKELPLKARHFRPGEHYRIHHLDEILEFVSGYNKATARSGTKKIRCLIEPKSADQRLVREIISRVGQDNGLVADCSIITFAFRSDSLKWTKQLDSRINTTVIVLNPLKDWITEAHKNHADTVALGWKFLNHFKFVYSSKHGQAALERIRKKVARTAERLELMGGIANSKANARWLATIGIKKIWTDDVELVRGALGR